MTKEGKCRIILMEVKFATNVNVCRKMIQLKEFLFCKYHEKYSKLIIDDKYGRCLGMKQDSLNCDLPTPLYL